MAEVPDWAREGEEEEEGGLTAWGAPNSVSFSKGVRSRVHSHQTSTPAREASWGVCAQIHAAGGRGRGNNRHAIAPSFPSAVSGICPETGAVGLHTGGGEEAGRTVDTTPFLVSAASGTPFPTGHDGRCSLATGSPSHHPSLARDAPRGHKVRVLVGVETRGLG